MFFKILFPCQFSTGKLSIRTRIRNPPVVNTVNATLKTTDRGYRKELIIQSKILKIISPINFGLILFQISIYYPFSLPNLNPSQIINMKIVKNAKVMAVVKDEAYASVGVYASSVVSFNRR